MIARNMPKTNIVNFEVDGKGYDIDLCDISGVEWRAAKQVTGMTSVAIIAGGVGMMDFEAVAALLWLWRRRDEPSLQFEKVLNDLSYRSFTPEEPATSPA